jgi:hypothetical protein
MALLKIMLWMQFVICHYFNFSLFFFFPNSLGLSPPPPNASSLEHRLRDRDVPALSLEQKHRDGSSGLTLSTSTPLFKKKPLGEANSQVFKF